MNSPGSCASLDLNTTESTELSDSSCHCDLGPASFGFAFEPPPLEPNSEPSSRFGLYSEPPSAFVFNSASQHLLEACTECLVSPRPHVGFTLSSASVGSSVNEFVIDLFDVEDDCSIGANHEFESIYCIGNIYEGVEGMFH
uniref:Uncharacterized protein n=1 Tax=Cacopsylla melanoneura TaxID=428564 RepID=A0A8D9ED00_9HEMI